VLVFCSQLTGGQERNENAAQLPETDRKMLGTIVIGLRSGVQVPAARRLPAFDSPPVAAVKEGIKKGNISTLVGLVVCYVARLTDRGELLGKSQFVWAYEFTQDPVVPECDITFTVGQLYSQAYTSVWNAGPPHGAGYPYR